MSYSIRLAFFPASITAMLSPQLWLNLYDSEDNTGPLEAVESWVGDVGDWGGDFPGEDCNGDLTVGDWGKRGACRDASSLAKKSSM